MPAAATSSPHARLRDRPWVLRWSSHMVYLGTIVVFLYITQFNVFSEDWRIHAILAPVIVAAVVLRTRFPYALPLLGILEVALLTAFVVFWAGLISLTVRRRGPWVWIMAGLGSALSIPRHLEYGYVQEFSPELQVISAVFWVLFNACTPMIIGSYIRRQRTLQTAAVERAARVAFEREVAARHAVSEERERIARDMHDSLGHILAQLSMQAGAMEVRARHSDDADAAVRIRETARSGLAELRQAVQVLGEDSRRTPTPTLATVPQLVESSRDAGADIALIDDLEDATTLPPPASRLAYQVVQEALTNAHRHAPGVPVSIHLLGSPGVGVTIVAENPLAPGGEAGSHTGLATLRRRAAVMGGTLDARTSHGMFTLTVRLPWEVSS